MGSGHREVVGVIGLHHGDCLDVLRTMPDNSVDSVVTDPPYGLSFMGKKWDYDVPSVEIWAECLRVLKPGGHLLAFAGTRTQHRMACRIEDAGFEIRDMIAWIYGSGFPKSLDVSKALDKAAGAEREVIGDNPNHRAVSGIEYAGVYAGGNTGGTNITAAATEAARQWQGWGTALKPALEPITLARKPLIGTVAANVTAHGTGGLNIDASRVEGVPPSVPNPSFSRDMRAGFGASDGRNGEMSQAAGRWPANLIHDGSDEVLGLFPVTQGGSARTGPPGGKTFGGGEMKATTGQWFGDSSSAARFFYCAKASKRDRDDGLEGFDARLAGCLNMRNDAHAQANGQTFAPKRNVHPTVKPTELMRYLCRLVTPPGGIVLDPFMGSGSTGKAAGIEGFAFIGIEREAEYVEIARARIAA